MHKVILLLILLGVSLGTLARPLPDLEGWLGGGNAEGDGELWALLIAGSAGWGNYRHQADVCHAVQVLRRGGIPEERMVVMMFDDIAHNPENPRQGEIINHPKGSDVYKGVPLDYTGRAVNANNFLAALTGNKTALEPPILGQGKFSGRVIEAGPNDRLFVYYSDHGAPGVVGMPSGPFLYADQLHRSLHNRSLAGGFKETVLYIEACESGSMFQGLLEENAGVYAVTAANEMESSWGTYCPNMGTDEPPPGFNTCLGDLFSVAWLENADKEDLTQETLKKQFQLVKYRTSSNWTYSQGSHVEHFGQLSIDEELAANFEGQLNKGDGGGAPPSSSVSSTWGGGAGWLCDYWARLFGSWGESGSSSVHNEHREIEETEEGEAVHYRSVLQRDADLLHLKGEALLQEKSRRKALDDSISAAISSLWQHLTLKEPSHPGVPMLLGTSPSSATPSTIPSSVVGALMQAPLAGRMPKSPLVDDWDCLRGMVAAWESGCGKLDQYGMKHTRVFANLCNAGVNPGLLREKGEHVCNGGEEQQQQQEVLVS